MSEQTDRAKEVFLAAIEENAPEQWLAFLERAGAGDSSLRASVEKLLRAHAAIGTFQEAPRLDLTKTVERPITERLGSVIGSYKLLEQIGEGGFGMVFMAEQQEPIRRKVALKVLKPGMDTKQVIARFEVERQALALMDHPNIARVLDAGATESGRPYFVMELVRGIAITEFCDKNHLPPEARLKLFLDVCHAIQHAHHKGVIHRDIKPTNVLVTLHDGVPVVKVIDFGVAKATRHSLTERTLFTAFGQMVGTPAYMSPEQAEMSGLDVDTRSDVYALGVLLYELLTGTTPLEEKQLRDVGYAELQRLIREQEAPLPSTRLSSLGDTATVMAGKRGLDVKKLALLLAGDLDWAVMKALEKDRNRRYDTPGNFAEDISRYLRREAILARPTSAVYKLKKFAQRNRAAALMGTFIAGALLVGSAVATWQAVVATGAKRDALRAAAAQKEAKELAQVREADTAAILDFLENRVLDAARPRRQAGGLGRDVTLRQAVEAALPFVEKSFTNQPLIEARLRVTLGQSFWYLGEAKAATEQWQAARTLYSRHLGPDHPDTLRSIYNLARGFAALGQVAEAFQLREETLALQKAKLGPVHSDTLRSMNGLASSYADLGRRADALKLREETLALQKANLGPDHPDTLASMHHLATSYACVDRQADALKLREETLALYRAKLGHDHPDTLRSMNALACSYAAYRRHKEAVKLYEETLELQKATLGADHPDTFQTMYNLAISYAELDWKIDALKLREESLALHRAKLGPQHPRTLMAMNNVAWSYTALGRHADALKLFQETLALQKARLGPEHQDSLWSLAGVAHTLAKLDRGAEAVPVIDEWVRLAAGRPCAPRLLSYLMDLRLRCFEKAKDAAGCRQTAEMGEKLKRTDARSLYRAARMRAVTAAVLIANGESADHEKQADIEADRAVVLLTQAVANGYKNVAQLVQDKDFDILRHRTDFMKLLAVLQARPPEENPSAGQVSKDAGAK
jgi:serine/threonine protein kinase/tetratricopeptide (TPR) repeat protein